MNDMVWEKKMVLSVCVWLVGVRGDEEGEEIMGDEVQEYSVDGSISTLYRASLTQLSESMPAYFHRIQPFGVSCPK